MTTLGSFGFTKGRKQQPIESQQLEKINTFQHAFISPVPLKSSKPKTPVDHTKSKRNTLQHYFAPVTKPQIDTSSEEETVVCVIRKQQPVSTLWDLIQSECDEQELFQTMMPEKHRDKKQKRSCLMDLDRPTKRVKPSHDISSIMHQFVRLNTHATIKRPSTSLVDGLLNESQVHEDKEDLSRPVKGRMSTEQSYLFVIHIAHEFSL